MNLQLKVKVFKMYPVLTTKITILNVAEVTSSKSGVKYVNVLFTDDRGNPVNMWFPFDYFKFAQDNVGKTVTAEMRFFRGFGDRRPNLSGISLSA